MDGRLDTNAIPDGGIDGAAGATLGGPTPVADQHPPERQRRPARHPKWLRGPLIPAWRAIRAANLARRRLEANAFRWATRNPSLVARAIWVFIALVMAVSFFLFFTGRLERGDVSYPGAFVANLIASASIVLPAPGMFAICAGAAEGLANNIVVLSLVGAVGSALGETTAWLAGFSEHHLLKRFRWYPRISDWMDRGGGLTILIASAIPNPFFDFAGIAAGALRYPLRRFLIYAFIGRAVRYIGTAYLCRQGIHWVVHNAESGGIMAEVRDWLVHAREAVFDFFGFASALPAFIV